MVDWQINFQNFVKLVRRTPQHQTSLSAEAVSLSPAIFLMEVGVLRCHTNTNNPPRNPLRRRVSVSAAAGGQQLEHKHCHVPSAPGGSHSHWHGSPARAEVTWGKVEMQHSMRTFWYELIPGNSIVVYVLKVTHTSPHGKTLSGLIHPNHIWH